MDSNGAGRALRRAKTEIPQISKLKGQLAAKSRKEITPTDYDSKKDKGREEVGVPLLQLRKEVFHPHW